MQKTSDDPISKALHDDLVTNLKYFTQCLINLRMEMGIVSNRQQPDKRINYIPAYSKPAERSLCFVRDLGNLNFTVYSLTNNCERKIC